MIKSTQRTAGKSPPPHTYFICRWKHTCTYSPWGFIQIVIPMWKCLWRAVMAGKVSKVSPAAFLRRDLTGVQVFLCYSHRGGEGSPELHPQSQICINTRIRGPSEGSETQILSWDNSEQVCVRRYAVMKTWTECSTLLCCSWWTWEEPPPACSRCEISLNSKPTLTYVPWDTLKEWQEVKEKIYRLSCRYESISH